MIFFNIYASYLGRGNTRLLYVSTMLMFVNVLAQFLVNKMYLLVLVVVEYRTMWIPILYVMIISVKRLLHV